MAESRFNTLSVDAVLAEKIEFPPLLNDLILRAARHEPVERTPIWLMRQAGRYLPEFREVRSKVDFFTLCRTPELACAVTLQPVQRYALDAAIIFCDILVVLQALGMEVQMLEKRGPVLPEPFREPSDLLRLAHVVDVKQSLGYVMEAIRCTRHALQGRVPLIGFSGAPFTLMAYAIEGGSSKSYTLVKRWLQRYPDASHSLLQRITDVCVDFLIEQVRAGAQMLQVFDSWAGELSPAHFSEFALPYLSQIATRVRAALVAESIDVPLSLFAKGVHYALDDLSHAGYDVLSIDWTIKPQVARAAVGNRVTLQGNLEPCVLFASDESIRKQARTMIDSFGTQNYIANLGHGMLPEHDPNSVQVLIEEVHRYSEMRAKEQILELASK